MKLIEKMAEDFAQNPMAIKRLMLDEGLGIGCPEIELGYIAGFRAAREMAYRLMENNSDNRIFKLDIDIVNIGEEEVE